MFSSFYDWLIAAASVRIVRRMEIHDSFDTDNLCGEQIYENVTHAYHGTIRERGSRERLAIQMHQFHGSSDKTTRFMSSSCMNQQPFPYLHNNA